MRRPDPYLYEDVPVLKNLLGIRSKTELKLVERNHSRIMLGKLFSKIKTKGYRVDHYEIKVIKMH